MDTKPDAFVKPDVPPSAKLFPSHESSLVLAGGAQPRVPPTPDCGRHELAVSMSRRMFGRKRGWTCCAENASRSYLKARRSFVITFWCERSSSRRRRFRSLSLGTFPFTLLPGG